MRRSMGITILQIALVFFLLVSGVTGLMQSTAGNLNPVRLRSVNLSPVSFY